MEFLNFNGVNVPEKDVAEALYLVKELRLKSMFKAIHPIALRIALKYALAIDDLLAQKHLTPEQEKTINKYVEKLVQELLSKTKTKP